jgi:UDP-N-acetylmuramoyl-tripeptide--D-alanyl-D-alanine ligase
MIGAEKTVITNQGNLNSETGLPLSVFAVRDHHQVGIFEAGMNAAGEIASLAAVLRPVLALITNTGPAHIGILGSLEAIASEKKQIFSRFTGTETALIPEDDPFTDFLSSGIKGNTVLYGQRSLEAEGIIGAIRDRGLAGTEIVWEGIPAVFGLPGKHNVKNAVAAAAVARELGISGDSIRKALASVKPLFGRGEILNGKTTVIRDCYNANPVSSAEALDFCDGVQWPGRKVYIIGTMLELGSWSEEAHRELGKRVASSKCDMAFFYGKETAPAADVLLGKKLPCHYTDDMGDLKKAVSAYVRPGDLVLLKGSRGCALEELSGVVLLKGE